MVVILLHRAAGNMTEKPQTSVSDQVGKRPASDGCLDFHVRHMVSVRYQQYQSSFIYYFSVVKSARFSKD